MWKIPTGLALGLVLAEGLFWLRDDGAFPHLNIYRSDAAYGVRLEADASTRIAFGGNPTSIVRTNRQGFRGLDWPEHTRGATIVLGDSQVFGLGVEEDATFSSELARQLGEPVYNAGVPTFGPLEYTALLEELLRNHTPRRVIYVLNMANDLFELDRPNRERHAAWDHWAVRIETAPEASVAFPGRSFLLSRSHAVFALRSLLHRERADDAAFASEGGWLDVANAAKTAPKPIDTATREHALRDQLDARSTLSTRWTTLDSAVVNEFSRLVSQKDRYGEEAKRLTGYKGNARDIVGNPLAESGRPVDYTAHQLMRAALALAPNTDRLIAIAEAESDTHLLGLLRARRDVRSALEKEGGDLTADFEHPLLGRLLQRTAELCARVHADLYVVALPLDVQVSPEEWAKYGLPARDLGPTEALLSLVTQSADAVFAEAIDALPALRSAEPGAFLNADLHMSAKGHRALATQIAARIKAPPTHVGSLRLPPGRSFPPTVAEWTSLGVPFAFDAASSNCKAYTLREWFRLICQERALPPPLGRGPQLELRAGGHGDAMLVADGESARATLPVLPGDRAVFSLRWPNERREVTLSRDSAGEFTLAFGPASPAPEARDARGQVTWLEGKVEPARLAVREREVFYDGPCMDVIQDDLTGRVTFKSDACVIDRAQRDSHCADGQVAFGSTRRCVARCDADTACAPGTHCETFAGRAGCIAP